MSRDAARPKGDADMNLLPMMNLVTLLIPLLLVAAQLSELAVIDSTVPGIIADQPAPDGPEPLHLALQVGAEGVTVTGAEAVLSPDEGAPTSVPCAGACAGPESYDLAEVQRLLGLVKEAHPDERTLILVPEARVPFSVLVAVMDASRAADGAELFPQVTLAGG